MIIFSLISLYSKSTEIIFITVGSIIEIGEVIINEDEPTLIVKLSISVLKKTFL